MKLRTTILAIAALGLVAGGLTAPVASAETSSTDDPQCMQVYLFVLDLGYVTVDASDSCPSVIVHEEEACEDLTTSTTVDCDTEKGAEQACESLAASNTALDHQGDCQFTLGEGPWYCPGPNCPFPIEEGAFDSLSEPPTYCVYPWGCT